MRPETAPAGTGRGDATLGQAAPIALAMFFANSPTI